MIIQKEDLKDLDNDELEIMKSKEESYKKSGEVLLESMLNLPFKNREKVESLLKKISVHKSNITIINSAIQDCITIYYPTSVSGITINWNGIHSNGYITNSSSNYSSYTMNYDFILKKTNVCYLDANNNKSKIEVIDDIFQSVLGNYYLNTLTGSIISLNRVIEIDEDSTLGKWYQKMCKNFEREVKLNRVLKDGNDE